MIWSKKRFQHSFELFPYVIKDVAPFLLPLSFLLWGLEFYVSYLNKARFENPYTFSMTYMIFIGVFGVVLQSLIGVFWVLSVSGSTRRQSLNGQGPHPLVFAQNHIHQALIEYIRAFMSIGLYAVFLILPGIIRWVRLSFTVLITAFDKDYQNGNKDALGESHRLTKGHTFALLVLLTLQSVFPLTVEEFGKSGVLPSVAIPVVYAISWLGNLYFTIYFTLTYFACTSVKKVS